MIAYFGGILLIAGIAVIQTNLLHGIAIMSVRPDLLLIVVTFIANKNGPGVGQGAGAFSGILQDLLSLAPLGFYTLVNTVIGFLYGFSKGNVFLDGLIFPMMLVALATLLKGLLFSVVAFVFGIEGVVSTVFSTAFLIEILYNALLAPVLYGIMGRMRWLMLDYRERNY
ncbi:MAG: rod shape-determining protein MreD [Spirochaetaceae bacterium]|nr:MAG: rod shape-determining protein MreD [Spirochaetaceae bacterium]